MFSYKLPYIGGEYWEDERTQLYPFLSQKQIVSVLDDAGFETLKVEYPIEKRGLARFLEQYDIGKYDIESFPKIQMAMTVQLGQK